MEQMHFGMAIQGMRPVTYQTTTPASVVIAELFARLKTSGRSERHLETMKDLLGRFGKHYTGTIGMLCADDVTAFLSTLEPISARTKNNYIAAVRSLSKFAIKKRYVPKWYDELDSLERFADGPKDVSIYTPDQVKKIIESCYRTVLPGVLLMLYGGLRQAEVLRLEWSDIDLKRRLVFVKASKSKTRQRRLCPVPDVLAQHLAKIAAEAKPEPNTKLYSGTRHTFCEMVQRSFWRAGIAPKLNGLRHSFVSYRLADVKDAAQVALEAGNSERVIFSNYREIVTPEDAARYWFTA